MFFKSRYTKSVPIFLKFKKSNFICMKSNFSYWEKSSFKNFDIIIIGSGIVGLNTAISLKLQNPILNICVLESGYLPAGASTKNAGFACFGSVSELIEQEAITGEEGLAKLIAKRWNGLSYLRKLLSDKAIDFKNYGGYEIFNKGGNNLAQNSVAKIEHFNQLIKNIIGKEAFKLDNSKINQFGFNNIETLIFNQYEGQIDSGKRCLLYYKKLKL